MNIHVVHLCYETSIYAGTFRLNATFLPHQMADVSAWSSVFGSLAGGFASGFFDDFDAVAGADSRSAGVDHFDQIGEGADAVLLGGADETPETNLVFSYMNLARAWAELETGADLYCLHRNRWWQTKHGPMLDSGAFVAGLEFAAQVEAIVLGKPSSAYFAAACEALDADPHMTWMIGDDVESDIAGAQGTGLRTVLVRTGKFRPDAVERARSQPDGIVSSIGQLPEWIEAHL